MKMINIIAAITLLIAVSAHAQDVKVETSALPKDASKFLTQHFTDRPIHHVTKDSGGSFEVKLNDGTEIEFRSSGVWHEVDGKSVEVPTSFLPAGIAEHTKANYPQQQITKIEHDIRKYDIDLSNGISLEFDLNGKFLRIDR